MAFKIVLKSSKGRMDDVLTNVVISFIKEKRRPEGRL